MPAMPTCLDCGLRHELEVLKQSFVGRGEIPSCRDCGGIVAGHEPQFPVHLTLLSVRTSFTDATLRRIAGSAWVRKG